MKKIFNILVLLILCLSLCAQSLRVMAPSQVYAGDNFTVRFEIDDHVKDFHGPVFKGFSVLSGPNQSSSMSMSFVNGHRTQSVQTSYSYTISASSEGTYTIDPAYCTIDGKRITSNSITVKVAKMTAAQKQQRQQQQRQRQAYDPWDQQPATASSIDENTLFARASVNKTNPYQGEQVIITYKIYTQVPISQFAIDKLPGNKGFWAEDLSQGKQIKQYEETVNGRRYQVAEIRRGALFAQESGKMPIEPLDLNVLAMVQRQRKRTGSIWDLFDDPFFNSQQAVERPLKTNRINVNVRPLPSSPDGFSGAVGHFDIKGGLNLKEVRANEAVSYKITVSGSGNLMLIDAPRPGFPNTFEVYDPQIEDQINKGDNGISGSRTYEYVLIPRSQGSYTIPEIKFIYFDPTSGSYVTKTIEAQTIEVKRGDPNIASTAGKDDVRLLAEDINYIHPMGKLHQLKAEEHADWMFCGTAALIIILTITTLIIGRKRQIDMEDVTGMRMRRATRMAQKRLKKASTFLGDGDSKRFYEEIYRAIWGCLADKYSIELSQLSRDTVSACLKEKQVSDEQLESIMKVLQDVDMARFAPGDAGAQKQLIYTEAFKMIAALN